MDGAQELSGSHASAHRHAHHHKHQHPRDHHHGWPRTIAGTHVDVGFPDNRFSLQVPARNRDEARQFLDTIGDGGLGAGIENTYLGLALPRIRAGYYQALKAAEREISEQKAKLGSRLADPVEFRRFVAWASSKRSRIARIYRLPAGAGAMLGGEVRDTLKYGAGGRSPQNLVAHQLRKGMNEEQAYARVLSTVDKPNVAETERILRAGKFFRRGGAVLIIGGLA